MKKLSEIVHCIEREKLDKILKVDRVLNGAKCCNCNADPKNPTWEDLETEIANCNNCRVDINTKGEWSGAGFEFMVNLYKKYPDDPRWVKLVELWNS